MFLSFLYKLFGILIQIDQLIFYMILLSVSLSIFHQEKYMKRVLKGIIVILFITTLSPLGHYGVVFLENYYPKLSHLPASTKGIIVLGGGLDYPSFQERQQACYNIAGGRILDALELIQRYPHLPLLLTGGGHRAPGLPAESEQMKSLIHNLSLKSSVIHLETQSMNTQGNAEFSFTLLKPHPQDTWVLVTSAVHMPRAVTWFRAAGWNVIPYPVDYHTPGRTDFLWNTRLLKGFEAWQTAAGEGFGLLFTYLQGKSNQILPSR